MKKKLTAPFLALVMCMTMSVPAFAAGYGHKQDSLDGLSLSIDSKGTPSFSAGVGFSVESYIARAVTLK